MSLTASVTSLEDMSSLLMLNFLGLLMILESASTTCSTLGRLILIVCHVRINKLNTASGQQTGCCRRLLFFKNCWIVPEFLAYGGEHLVKNSQNKIPRAQISLQKLNSLP